MTGGAPTCPRCGAPRAPGPECPRCGVIYARARPRPAPALRAPEATAPVEPPAAALAASDPASGVVGDARGLLAGQAPAVWEGDRDEARGELYVRAVAPPAALLVAWALVATGAGHALVRTFLSMWVHELGHAVAAWLCGFGAFPGPWRTPVSEGRYALVVILVGAGFAGLGAWGWRTRRWAPLVAGVAGLVVQLACTLLPLGTARAFFTFGGDAGCMVIGAVLFATIWSDPRGRLGRGWLRWGFLVIGACALVDALHGWIRGAAHHDEIPFGQIEGVGLSDASKLVDVHGWSVGALTGRYVALGLACLGALAVAYAVALIRARTAAQDASAALTGSSAPGPASPRGTPR